MIDDEGVAGRPHPEKRELAEELVEGFAKGSGKVRPGVLAHPVARREREAAMGPGPQARGPIAWTPSTVDSAASIASSGCLDLDVLRLDLLGLGQRER